MKLMEEFNSTFFHLQGGKSLEKFIGRKVRFVNSEKSDGLIHKYGIFEVIGTQLDYAGKACLRVKCISYNGEPFNDRFGSPMSLGRVAFV